MGYYTFRYPGKYFVPSQIAGLVFVTTHEVFLIRSFFLITSSNAFAALRPVKLAS